jgi:hypothetical protein
MEKANRMQRQVNKNEPTITNGFPIEVPTNEYYSMPCVYKIWFGSKYLIMQGKAMWQSANIVSIQIDRMLRSGTNDDTSFVYNAVVYIRRGRIMRGYLEPIYFLEADESDFSTLLQETQKALDKAKNDTNNLNNNFIAYVPNWMPSAVKTEFNQWIESRKNKKNKTKKK